MERKISFADVQKAVEEAYELFKSDKEGAIDSRVAATAKAGTFGISVMLTDGRAVNKADADVASPLGAIAKVPLSIVLLSQNGADGLVKKSGKALCCCHCSQAKEMDLPFSRHGVRAVSAVVPQGDNDGKFAVISDMVVAMTGSEPSFNDELYKYYRKEVNDKALADEFEKAGYTLYDNAAISVDVYTRLLSLQLSTKQLAAMGASVAADGRNPLKGVYAFDGSLAASAVTMMATHGKKFAKAWMMLTGVPAKKSFGGAILAVMPGFGAIAAYAPEVDEQGISVKAAKAIQHIANALGLNVFASARVVVE